MNSNKYSEADWEKSEKKNEEASQGLFFKLPNDQDKAYVYFIQPPITVEREHYQDKSKKSTKSIANIAVFDSDGKGFMKLQLAEMAPTHWKQWLSKLRDKETGGFDKLYRIKREGIARDKDTTYPCDRIRDMTADELTMLNGLKLLTINTDGSDSEADWLNDFRGTCAAECERIGWNQEQMGVSLTVFFGQFIKAADMSGEQRSEYLGALQQMSRGSAPEAIKGDEPKLKADGSLDLDEEVDFF